MKFFKKAFTVVEMMIVVLILSVWLLGVISTLSDAYSFLYNMKNKISAINFARWWMEWVFNIRATNWQRWWDTNKYTCWLKVNPLVDEKNVWCEDDTWFSSWNYVIDLTWNEQKYFYLQKVNWDPLLTGWNLTWSDWKYLLCKNADGIVSSCWNYTQRPNNYFDSVLFFRQVRWWYLLDKYNNNFITCDKWNDLNCWDGRALEKNFCVDVVWFDGDKRSVSFCSVLTNFKK